MPYFQAFQPFSVTVTFFMNSITFVMNHLFSYFDISICHSSNRTLSYRLLLTHGFNQGYVLGGACYIHLTTRTNAVFSSFSAFFGYGDLLYELNHLCDELPVFLFQTKTSLHPDISFETSSYCRLTQQIFFINADIKYNIIAFNIHRIDCLVCILIYKTRIVQYLS